MPDYIEDSNWRFYAYNHFYRHPERLLGRFAKHLGEATTADATARVTEPA